MLSALWLLLAAAALALVTGGCLMAGAMTEAERRTGSVTRDELTHDGERRP